MMCVCYVSGSLCPNLQELDATGVRLNRYGLQRLGSGCTKLKKLNLNCKFKSSLIDTIAIPMVQYT